MGVSSVDDVAQLVEPLAQPAQLDAAWGLVEELYGFGFPQELVELSYRFGPSSVWGEGLVVWGPQDLFIRAPEEIGSIRVLRDDGVGPRRVDSTSSTPIAEPDGVDYASWLFAPEWPMWPEPRGAVAVAWYEGDQVYLLRHKHPTKWTVGIQCGDNSNYIERPDIFVDWFVKWLNGSHDFTGEAGGDYRSLPSEPSVAATECGLRIVTLEPTSVPLEDRIHALTRLARGLSVASHDQWRENLPKDLGAEVDDKLAKLDTHARERPQLLSPLFTCIGQELSDATNALPYQSAPWERLDVRLDYSAVGGSILSVECWYDVATDNTGAHRFGCHTARDDADRAIDDICNALGSPVAAVHDL